MIDKSPTTEERSVPKSSVERPAPQKPHNLIFIFILIGIFVATAFLIPRIPGLFTKWEKLPPAPAKPIDLIGTSSFWSGPGIIYVQAEDEQVYMLEMSNRRWSVYPLNYEIASSECNLSTIKFLSWKRPFEKPFQCAQVYGHGDVAPAPLFTFVLDQKGNLWYWPQESSLMFLSMLCLLGALGLIAGVLLNFIWLAIQRAKLKHTHTEKTEQGMAAEKMEYSTMRWVARIWSLVSMLYFVLNDLHDYRGIYFQATAVLAIIGLVIGWIRPLIGGVIVLTSFLINTIVTLTAISGLVAFEKFLGIRGNLSLAGLLFLAIFYLPGLLFLFAGLQERNQKRNYLI